MDWGGSHFYKDVIPAIKKHLKVWASDTQLLPTHSTPTSASPDTYAVPSFVGSSHLRALTLKHSFQSGKNYCLPGQWCGGQKDKLQVSLELHDGGEHAFP